MLYVGRGRKSFASEVSFNEALHEYSIHGRILSGVTRKICERMKLNFSDAENLVVERCDEGSQVHKWIQEWIDTGVFNTIHPGAKWVHDELIRRYAKSDCNALAMSEVLISDLGDYASAIDIVVEHDGVYDLYDIKTGKFKPEYLAWQLGCYKWFMTLQGKIVDKCACICVHDKMVYRVLPRDSRDVQILLYGAEGGKYGTD